MVANSVSSGKDGTEIYCKELRKAFKTGIIDYWIHRKWNASGVVPQQVCLLAVLELCLSEKTG